MKAWVNIRKKTDFFFANSYIESKKIKVIREFMEFYDGQSFVLSFDCKLLIFFRPRSVSFFVNFWCWIWFHYFFHLRKHFSAHPKFSSSCAICLVHYYVFITSSYFDILWETEQEIDEEKGETPNAKVKWEAAKQKWGKNNTRKYKNKRKTFSFHLQTCEYVRSHIYQRWPKKTQHDSLKTESLSYN